MVGESSFLNSLENTEKGARGRRGNREREREGGRERECAKV